METLKLQDYEDIVDETRFVSAVSPSVNSSGQAIYGANNAPTTVYGISPTTWRYGATKSRTATCSPNRTSRQPPKLCVVGQDRRRQPLPRRQQPGRQGHTFSEITFPHRRRAGKQRIQQHGNGPGRPNLSSIHNYSEKGPGHHPSARHYLFGPSRRNTPTRPSTRFLKYSAATIS